MMLDNSFSTHTHTHMRTNNQGFTLIELMVAVTIVAILVNMALPLTRVFKIKAARAEAQVNMNYGHTLVKSYIADNGTQPPGFGYGVSFRPDGSTSADGRFHSDGSVDCNWTGSNEIGFRGNDCINMRYTYRFLSAFDGLRTQYGSSKFSMDAFTARIKPSWGATRWGRGFGFAATHCNSGSLAYFRDNLVLNQDREFGVYGSKQATIADHYNRLYNAMLHCTQ